jgi:gliding motility-associated-like protein
VKIKRKIFIDIQFSENIFGWKTVFLILFLFSTDIFSQIGVRNPCAIDYNSIISSVPPGPNPPPDPRGIYYTSTTFIDEDPTSSGGVWFFGDGSPSETGKVVQHQYLTDGIFTVTLVIPSRAPITKTVTINYAPKEPYFLSSFAKRDTSLCADFLLDPYKGLPPTNVSYLWYPNNSTNPKLLVQSSDLYSVKVTDNTTGCSISGNISVIVCGTPDPPLQSIAEYHFGNGIKRLANHGNAAFATDYPIGEEYQNSGVINSATAASSVANPNPFHFQRYLFTSDGSNIYRKDGSILANNISGIGKKAKQTLIVPKIESDTIAITQYYVLTVNEDGVLSYTLLDASGKAEGDANVIDKNIQLLTGMNGKLTATKYFRTPLFTGYYVVVAGNDGFYYSFKITRLGIQGPVRSPGVGAGKIEIGQLKFSDDGSKLISAISAPPFNQIQVCDFDSTTSAINGCTLINLEPGPQQLYGIEFSPDKNYIYYTLNSASGGVSEFRRYDIANGRSTLIQRAKNKEQFGALEAYKVPGYQTEIVVAVNGEPFISTLERPNALIPDEYLVNDADTTVAFRQDILKYILKAHNFTSAKSTLGLNNAIELPQNSSPSSDAMQFESDCVDKAIIFQATPKCDVDPMTIKYEWDFGDGSASGTGQKASHTYTKAGQYKVRLFITYCAKQPVIVEDLVIVIPKPFTDLLPNYETCFETKPELSIPVKVTNLKELEIVYASQLEYDWTGGNIVTGAATNKITVNGPTKLDLKVLYFYPLSNSTIKTCENEFKTDVTEFCPPVFAVPEVYTPNGDGFNDKLQIVKDDIDKNNYRFRIYNRWGQLVYFSEESPVDTNPWDGKFNGKDCEADTFAWTVEYRSRFKPNGPTFKSQGAILLVR